MELPIRIIITLFVAVVVGSTLIVFSKQMIDRAREDIEANRPGIDPTEAEEQKIIQLNRIDTFQIIDLMEECYRMHHAKSFSRELCYIVVARDAELWQWSDIEDHFSKNPQIRANFTIRNVNEGDYAFNIYFDPYGAYETIEVSK